MDRINTFRFPMCCLVGYVSVGGVLLSGGQILRFRGEEEGEMVRGV